MTNGAVLGLLFVGLRKVSKKTELFPLIAKGDFLTLRILFYNTVKCNDRIGGEEGKCERPARRSLSFHRLDKKRSFITIIIANSLLCKPEGGYTYHNTN